MKSITFFGVISSLTMMQASAQEADGDDSSSSSATQARLQTILEGLNQTLGHDFLYALAGSTGLVFIYRISQYFNQHTRMLACLHSNTQRYFAIPSVEWSAIKHHLLYAPLCRVRHSREFLISRAAKINMGTLPTRFQTLFLIAVLATNITLCIYNVPWSDPELSVLPILRNRTGTISVANFIPIIIISTVKNPLISLLNISFDTFNLMHRWFARIAIAEAVTHSICHTVSFVQQTNWHAFLASCSSDPMTWTGLVCTSILLFVAIQSTSPFRHAFYETFLHLHILFVIVVLIFLWMHLDGLPQQTLLLAAIIFWVLARTFRLTTLLHRSVALTSGRTACKATLEALPGNAVRVSFTSPHPWTFKPGQYMYVAIPSVGMHTLHPFSIAWSDVEYADTLGRMDSIKSTSSTPTTKSSCDEKQTSNGVTVTTKTLPTLPHSETTGHDTFSIVLLARTGFTSSLHTRALSLSATPRHRATLPAFIEGPYGVSNPMSSYGTVLLFAGGIGITHQLPYLRHLIQGAAEGTVAARRVVLVWAMREVCCLEWIRPWMQEVLGMEGRREVLKVFLYVTRGQGVEAVKSPSRTVQMRKGRPDIERIVRGEVSQRVGCVGVSVCGPGGLGDEVRRVVRGEIGKGRGGGNVEFMEEAFSW